MDLFSLSEDTTDAKKTQDSPPKPHNKKHSKSSITVQSNHSARNDDLIFTGNTYLRGKQ